MVRGAGETGELYWNEGGGDVATEKDAQMWRGSFVPDTTKKLI